jgi:hypothetical protein
MAEAIPFITYKDQQFEIHSPAAAFLRSIIHEPVSVVSMIGKYRSGKSYLIN